MRLEISGSSSLRLPLQWQLLLWFAILVLPAAAFAQERPTSAATYLRGRAQVPHGSSARQLDLARRNHVAMLAQPRNSTLTAAWIPVGPTIITSPVFGAETGRVTAIAVDPADPSGNIIYVGTTGGGVWKSTNAAGPSATVSFTPLTDTITVFNAASQTIPSLSIGSLAIANGIVLAGTGDPNDATDSYYGAGILRSTDGGITWTLAQQSTESLAQPRSFFGLSVAGLAFSTLNPKVAVAALSQSVEGAIVNVPGSEMGLYYSSDAGLTWQMATIQDGSQTVQSASISNASSTGNAVTSVVWNPVRQQFVAAVRFHGYYSSPDGATWTRLVNQPGQGLTTVACPTNRGLAGQSGCPIFRGALAVQPTTGDTFAITVDANNNAQGLYQDQCGLINGACGTPLPTFGTQLNVTPAEQGTSDTIPQADYNLALAAAPSGSDTLLYLGTTDLYRCSLAGGCFLRNTTNSTNGCTNPAMVAPSQHAIAMVPNTSGPIIYLGNDGGIWRSMDGVNQTAAPCSPDDATHFQNLNGALGSLAEVVSFSQSPTDPSTLLAGFGALGTAATSSAGSAWVQLSAGEGGTVAIDPGNPALWYISTGAGVEIARCSQGASCVAGNFVPVIGAAQVANDIAAVHAPWLLDPGDSSNVIAGTCRLWRGAATGGALWSSANNLSRPFGTSAATACGSTSPVVRSLAAGGPVVVSAAAQNSGDKVIYAGLAGTLDGGQGIAGHVLVSGTADRDTNQSVWTDLSGSPVTNDLRNAGIFNPGGFNISSLTVDPHDATGATVYATVMGFDANYITAPHIYGSTDMGAHWVNLTANLPDAPANSAIVDPNDANTVYIALDTGVYVTTQIATCASTNCWSIYGTALPNSPVIQLMAAAAMPTGDGRLGELRAATYGRGIWEVPLLTAMTPSVPAIAINPSTVTYNPQQVGTASQPVTIVITNTGTAVLSVSSVTSTGDFVQTNSCVGSPILQGATCLVQVTFLPTASGSRTGLLTVYGNVAGGQATASLAGIGTPAAVIVLTPTVLIFSGTNVGATSIPQAITVSNTGGTLSQLQAPFITGDFLIQGNTCGAVLAPATGCTLSIAFAPTASGSRSGTLVVTDPAGSQVASLSGTATNPATDSLAPSALTFAAQQLSTVSPSQQVTLTNAGDVALTLISANISAGDFSLASACGNSLAARSVCAITVTFSPKSIGAQVGTLVVADQFRTQTLALAGTGIAGPGVSLSPLGGLAFAATGVGLTASPQIVTLSNNGGAPLAISAVTLNGDYNILAGANTCGTSLAPSAMCSIQVVFAPTASGSRPGSITFTDNAPGSPQTEALTGTGIDFGLAANGPSSITIASGQTATYALLLTSAPGLPGSVAFTCAGVPAHSLCTVNPTTTSLGGTTNISVTVATGLSSAALRPPSLPWNQPLFWFAVLIPIGLATKRVRPRWVAVAALVVMAGCSTGRTIPTTAAPGAKVYITPSGTYNLVVAGSSAGVVHAVNLTLVVQ